MKKKLKVKNILLFIMKILPPIFWFLLIFGFDLPYIAILTIIAAVIHEGGHIIATYMISERYKLKGVLSGFRLTPEKHLSYDEEIIIALFGPLANISAFVLASPFVFISGDEYTVTFGILNLFTALSNLLPVESYDGYRIIQCLILKHSSGNIGISLLKKFSFAILTFLSFLSLYFIKSFDGGYWIFFIFIAILIKTIKKDENVFFVRKREKKRVFKRF